MAHCPNKNLQEWKDLVSVKGENEAYYIWDKNSGDIEKYKPEILFQLNNKKILAPAIQELDNYLLNFMKSFGVSSKQFDDLKSKIGVDALGATDVLNKLIWYSKNRNSETIPEEVGHMAVMLMGEKHPEVNELLGNIENWSEYQEVYDAYMPIYKDVEKVKIEAIGKLLAKSLVSNYGKTGTDKSLVEKALTAIKNLLERLLSGKDITNIFLYNENIADKIALNILSGNKDYIRKITNLNSNLNFEYELNSNPLAKSLIERFANQNVKVTGSLAVAAHGENIRRPQGEGLHDVDFKVKNFEEFTNIIIPQIENLNSVPAHYGWHKKNYSTYAYLVAQEGLTIKVLERKDDFSNGWITSYELYDQNGRQVEITQKNVIALDFFVYKVAEKGVYETASMFTPGSSVYEGKMSLGGKSNPYFFSREKDQEDYVLRNPKSFTPTKNSVYFQEQETQGSKASEQTLTKVKEALVKMGVNLQTLEEYAKSTDVDVSNLNGVANLTRGVIAIAQDHEDVALTEEMVHIATAILEQTNPKLVTELISKIERFKIFKKTFEQYKNNKNYQLPNGKPDIRKIKKEAVDKLIAEVIVNNSENGQDFPELQDETTRRSIQKWWETIKDYIRGVYRKSNIDIFKQAAEQVISGDVGTVEDIKETGVFYQIKNDLVDKLYDTIVDFDSRLQLNPATVNDKRHYTFDGEIVTRSVTEKVKGKSTMTERTPEQKISDDQKRNWGSEGHAFVENYITENLIDKDGYKKETFSNTPINSELNTTIQKNLKAFAEELIGSYAEGTRFVVERKVVNTQEKGMLASTVDFLAIEPNDKTGIKVDILDWKFSSLDKTKDEDIPWYKRKEWQPQMGEYTKIMYQYGLKPNQLRKARMIPFISNYEYSVTGDQKSPLQLKSIEIGKLDSLTETNLYLLPVALNTETTGNKAVDTLLDSLRQQWEKLYKKKVSEEEKYGKNIDLNELSKAIRFLHLKLDFEPLYSVGKTFLENASKLFVDFDKLDLTSLNEIELNKKLGDLIEYSKSARKFTDIDMVFLSNTPKDELSLEDKKTLTRLEHLAGATERMLKKIERLQTEVTIQIAERQGVDLEIIETDAGEKRIQAEVAVNTFAKSFLEGSKLSASIVNLASNLIMNAKNLTKSSISRQMKEFEKVLLPLEAEAKAKGKKAFDMIATMSPTGLTLIKKIDRAFWDEIANAKDSKNKQFFLDNINKEEYDKLAKEAIDKGINDLNSRQFSSDEKLDNEKREYAIERLKNSLDIDSKSFNGYSSIGFSILFNKTMIEEGHYSKEYEEMRKSENALNVWKFFTELNKKGKDMGYLGKQGSSFFPLIEATTLEKFYQTNDIAGQSLDFFKDLYTTNVNEEQSLSKVDFETGQVKKEIPKYFTSTDKKVNQLSTDLNKVGAMWIKSLADYQTAKTLENTLLTLHSAEQAKGSLILGPDNNVIMEAGVPKVDYNVNKNAEILQTIIDDAIYGIKEDLGSIGNTNLNTITGKFAKDSESKENSVVNIKKGLKNSDTLIRSLAVGMRPLIALANWAGYQFQAYINSGNMYTFKEFQKNNVKMTVGNISTTQRALLDLVIPLSEDLTLEMRRQLAKKQGWVEYISTWSFTDVMMITNAYPEKKLQFTNALSFIENSMVVNGKIVNIRQLLKEKDRKAKYQLSQEERKALEKTFEERVLKLKESSALSKVAVLGTEDITIPGVSDEEIAKFRTKIIEYGRNLNGQMNEDNKAGYRRDTIFSSFMMFKNWIPKLVSSRVLDIKKNVELDEWEYGRGRAFMKAWVHLGLKNTSKMLDIINGTEEGLRILDEMLEAKKIEHYRKTGQTLTITNEEFYDLMRQQIENQVKELKLLVGTMGLLIAAKMAEPPEDATDLEKNRYKFWAKAVNKINDEISFYYNPASMDAISKGSLIPSIGLLHKLTTIFTSFGKYGYGEITNDEEMMEDANPLKYFLNVVPVGSQFQTDILPYVAPDLAKEMGIRVTVEARRQ